MKKAIFVDGPALFNMGRILGVKLNDRILYRILAGEVGECRELHAKPIYVVPSHKEGDLRKNLSNAGFEVRAASSFEGKDDKAIKQEIGQLTSTDVSEIVLAGCDADYMRLLEEKQNAGIKIYLFATDEPDPASGKPMILEAMKNLFTFVEIRPFLDQGLRYKFWETREDPGGRAIIRRTQEDLSKIEVKISLKGNPSAVAGLLKDLAELSTRHRHVKFTSSLSN